MSDSSKPNELILPKFGRTGQVLARRLHIRFPRPAFLAALLAAVVCLALYLEARTSVFQSRILSRFARELTYRVEPGPSDAIAFPAAGPFDLARGYAGVPAIADDLGRSGYRISAQARMSPRLLRLSRWGIYPVYHEKTRAGLTIQDRAERTIYEARFPSQAFDSFESIPPVIIQSLLFVENRPLLNQKHPYLNPSVEWDRTAKAALEYALNRVGLNRPQPGGSTLAVQIVKYRHSPEGRTGTPREKARQIATASLQAYLDGPETIQARRQIVLDYINSVPMAAYPQYGDVTGLAEGLWVWYDADLAEVTRLLSSDEAAAGGRNLTARAKAYKEVLSLFIAQRRPSYYLLAGHAALEQETNNYLRLLARAAVITPALRDVALGLPLRFRHDAIEPPRPSFVQRKAVNAVRTELLEMLGLDDFYQLDRLDLNASSTIDGALQRRITGLLRSLHTASYVDSAGLHGSHLLEGAESPEGINYSFTLYERTPQGNLLRVQADNVDEPFDVNEGAKLDLGSTAKLRTLVHYLEIVSEIHHTYAGKTPGELARAGFSVNDPIRRWAMSYLASAPDTSEDAMLKASLQRSYSASPGEGFFTGGGLHYFHNFNEEDDGRVMSISDAFRNSVNLVFIRVMRDIVRYHMAESDAARTGILKDEDHPDRAAYLARFADEEGKTFLARFWKKYNGQPASRLLDAMVGDIRPTPRRLAVIYRSVEPEKDLGAFTAFIGRYCPGTTLTRAGFADLYDTYQIDKFSLQDRGYLARLHPLELWLVQYLTAHPGAKWHEAVDASASARQEVYGWLFKPGKTHAQNKRIQVLLEEDAFDVIHDAWQRVGYPFDRLVPSYASAIGASADRPAALAELVGIIEADGVRSPSRRILRLDLAQGTPFETVFEADSTQAQRVLEPAVARALRGELSGVVENGTARRAADAYRLGKGTPSLLAGKTGTGDHRYDTFAPGGRLIGSKVMNRTATFVFTLGDRYFGTITAHVPGQLAASYKFTSALPVQIMKVLAPDLMALVRGDAAARPVARTGGSGGAGPQGPQQGPTPVEPRPAG